MHLTALLFIQSNISQSGLDADGSDANAPTWCAAAAAANFRNELHCGRRDDGRSLPLLALSLARSFR